MPFPGLSRPEDRTVIVRLTTDADASRMQITPPGRRVTAPSAMPSASFLGVVSPNQCLHLHVVFP